MSDKSRIPAVEDDSPVAPAQEAPRAGLPNQESIGNHPAAHPAAGLSIAILESAMSHKPRILIVEDDGLLQKMYKMKFILEGYEVDTADDGEEGLSKAREHTPDIMLLDILMPKLNGLQVLGELRRDRALASVPVVMLTNLSNMDKVEQAIGMGAAGYLVKSGTTPKDVLDFVKDTMARHRVH